MPLIKESQQKWLWSTPYLVWPNWLMEICFEIGIMHLVDERIFSTKKKEKIRLFRHILDGNSLMEWSIVYFKCNLLQNKKKPFNVKVRLLFFWKKQDLKVKMASIIRLKAVNILFAIGYNLELSKKNIVEQKS